MVEKSGYFTILSKLVVTAKASDSCSQQRGLLSSSDSSKPPPTSNYLRYFLTLNKDLRLGLVA
jgi:hypothetical protein